jgi:Mg-chelatase subunit ChlI
MSSTARRHLPLAAIVGQETFKAIYLANIVDPAIGGLLITGPKGTGKSTVAHAVTDLLPEYDAVEGCPFQCDPGRPERFCTLCRERKEHRAVRARMRIVNLPLSCTEDRLIGSVDIEALLREGRRVVQAGVLGLAHRNILYVDEVNLLPDHLVDDILDAASSHWNTIEREGISISHPTDFVLVGTMNPEEGELRPQILDRFPLCIRLDSVRDPDLRVEIIRRNLLFEADPSALFDRFQGEEELLRETIVRARARLGEVEISDPWLRGIAEACTELKVDGQRPDIVIVKASRALTALAGTGEPRLEDVLLAAELALNHRTRDGGLLDPPTPDEIRSVFRKRLESIRPEAREPGLKPPAAKRGAASSARSGGGAAGGGEGNPAEAAEAGHPKGSGS